MGNIDPILSQQPIKRTGSRAVVDVAHSTNNGIYLAIWRNEVLICSILQIAVRGATEEENIVTRLREHTRHIEIYSLRTTLDVVEVID